MKKTITINGVDYIEKDSAVASGDHVIVIADRGWIFEGYMSERYKLTGAHVVRKWDNGLGIGGLQTAAHKDDYTLDELPGGIEVTEHAVIAVLPITEW